MTPPYKKCAKGALLDYDDLKTLTNQDLEYLWQFPVYILQTKRALLGC